MNSYNSVVHGNNAEAFYVFMIIVGLLILAVRAVNALWKLSAPYRIQRRINKHADQQAEREAKFLADFDHAVDEMPSKAKAS